MEKKVNKTLLYRIGVVLLLVIIAVIMIFIGRKHIIYVDNKTLDDVSALYKIEVSVKNNDTKKLYQRERGEITIMGQKAKLNLVVTDKKGGSERELTYTLHIPFKKDAVVVNIPAMLKGLDESIWMTDFVSLATATTAEDATVVLTDDGMGDL